MQAWVNKLWVPEVGYASSINLLINGWINFIFPEEEKLIKILGKVWLYNEGSLFLKRWLINFNPSREKQTRRHIWMLLPSFPLELWTKDVLEGLENSVKKIIMVDKNSLHGMNKMVARVMVELDIAKGILA